MNRDEDTLNNNPLHSTFKETMPKTLTRREFLKLAAGATAATGLAPAVRSIVIEPFVRPPEELLPGQATWYASTCRQCPAGCGIIVRTINGRAKKIEGNPLHPLNRGKLCARGQAGLQVLYNPDRLKNAVRQSGGRGSRQFEPLYWPEALDLLSDKIAALSSAERIALGCPFLPDAWHHRQRFGQLETSRSRGDWPQKKEPHRTGRYHIQAGPAPRKKLEIAARRHCDPPALIAGHK